MHNDVEKKIEGFELEVGDTLETILDPNNGTLSFLILKIDKSIKDFAKVVESEDLKTGPFFPCISYSSNCQLFKVE